MGKVQLELKFVDIRSPITNAIESVEPLLKERRQTFIRHVLETPMVVKADQNRLEQVFVNLLARPPPLGSL